MLKRIYKQHLDRRLWNAPQSLQQTGTASAATLKATTAANYYFFVI
jgi:hypothetical protein